MAESHARLDPEIASISGVRPGAAARHDLLKTVAFGRVIVLVVMLGYVATQVLAHWSIGWTGLAIAVAGYMGISVLRFRRHPRNSIVYGVCELGLQVGWIVIDTNATWIAAVLMLTTIGISSANRSLAYQVLLDAAGIVVVTVVLWFRTPLAPWPSLVFLTCAGVLAICVSQAARSVREVDDLHQEVIGALDAFVWAEHPEDRAAMVVDESAVRVLGYPPEQFLEPGFWRTLVHPEDQEVLEAVIEQQVATHGSVYAVTRMRHADGSWRWIEHRVASDFQRTGKHHRFSGVMADRTSQVQAQITARRFADVVFSSSSGHILVVPERDELVVLAANDATRSYVAEGWEDLAGLRLHDLEFAFGFGRDLVEVVSAAIADEADAAKTVIVDSQCLLVAARPINANAIGVSIEDVTHRVAAEEHLRQRAIQDPLTGLPNRAGLLMALNECISDAAGDSTFSLMFLDLNQFKEVNDALGHHVGDALLIEVAKRLEAALPDNMVARLGGDEFAIFGMGGRASAERIASDAVAALDQVFHIQNFGVHCSASIGIALWPEHGETPDLLMQHADVAMYAGKRKGGGWVVYSPEHDQSSIRRLNLIGALRPALEAGEFSLAYQPIMEVDTARVVSCEALLRWRSPQLGIVAPSEFIPLAEVSGVIRPITRWVVREALLAAHRFDAAGFPVIVSCNLSVRNLYETDLVGWITAQVGELGIPRSGFRLEITETDAMEDPTFIRSVLEQFRALGISSSIDDFGTGYSSLVQLRQLPVDFIKVDQSFIKDLVRSVEDQTIVRSLVELGHNLGMGVVAEGVESEETLEVLQGYGCDFIQGYWLSRPREEADFLAFLATRELAEASLSD